LQQERTQLLALEQAAYAGDTDRQKVWSAGFQKHIAKPVDPTKLITLIAELVSGANPAPF
jgi:CheY-like chemotaxis protein